MKVKGDLEREPSSPMSPGMSRAGQLSTLPVIRTGPNDSNLSPQNFVIPGQSSGLPSRMATTGSAFYEKQKQDAQAERLIHSVNAVTELLKANTELRETNEKIERELDNKDAENTGLNIEN